MLTEQVAVLSANRWHQRRSVAPASGAVPISAVDAHRTRPCPTGIDELDRVLGGGARSRFGDTGRRPR